MLNLNNKNRAPEVKISSTYDLRPTENYLGCIINTPGLQFLHGLVLKHTEQNRIN